VSERGLQMLWERADTVFFKEHASRCFHIRKAYKGEMRGEFWSLGQHEENRRHILLRRVDFEMKPLPDGKVMRIPFLAFADETIEDTDEVLFPIVRDVMLDALQKVKS